LEGHFCYDYRLSYTMATDPARLHHPGPLHPAGVSQSAIKSPAARPIQIKVKDPLDHEAPAILHEPRNYDAQEANQAAVVLISGAGGGVSGPAGMVMNVSKNAG
jgi:hypothetical protein